VYDREGRQIPVTYATSGSQRNTEWDTPTGESTFMNCGFQYDTAEGSGTSGMYLNVGFCLLEFGIARGVNEYLPGMLCEDYPEVQEFWMGRVRECLDAGVDGIDIRIASHTGNMQDPAAFGFDEPLLDEYRRQAGGEPAAYDFVTRVRIRGQFFTQFLRKAADEIHASGKPVLAHVYSSFATGNMYLLGRMGVWPDWERWVRDIVDGITFRDFHFRYYHPAIGETIKRFAHGLGREVWMPCYIWMGRNLNETFLTGVQADPHVTGVLFYQSTNTYDERDGRFEFLPEYGQKLKQFIEQNR